MGIGSGSSPASTMRSSSRAISGATWYDSSRATPWPSTADATAARTLLTTSRGVNESMVAEALTGIVSSGFLWDGVTDATMIRGEGWLFLKLGKFVERIDSIARLVSARLSANERRASGERSGNVEWLTLLKSFDALDAYRKAHPKRVDRRAVVEFVLFETEFPRTLRYSTNEPRPDYNANDGGATDGDRFGSSHPGGMNVALCDGSVRFVPYTISLDMFKRLGNKQDGAVVQLP